MSMNKRQRSKTASVVRPDIVKKLITVDGGVMEIDDITLKFGPGCLAQDTEITLIKDDRNLAFKALHKLGLINAIPRVIECLPDGLKFLKPACLTVRFETKISELFILHGAYNRDFQKTIWKLVPNDVEEKSVDGAVNVQINEFCLYSFISAQRGMIARILSHLNQSFTCRAYLLYRRVASTDMIDISVVLISEFVDDNNKKDIKQLKDHYDKGYTKGERGKLKKVDTDRRLEMFLDFPGVESTPISFKVNQPQLDSVGFVIDDFKKKISVKYPANGRVKVHEVSPTENKLLWNLSVREIETVITCQQVQSAESTESDDEPKVVYRTTRLTKREIRRISTLVGVDWNRVAGLMNIPYSEREEIRMNHAKYPDSFSKAEKIFSLFNDREDFCRGALEKCVEELNLRDAKSEIRPVGKNEELKEEQSYQTSVCPSKDDTPLSPREMSRLSGRLSVSDSYKLAAVMGISNEERENIRSNPIYSNGFSCAEKFLSIFNGKENFSRKALGDCFREIQKLDLIAPVITGEWGAVSVHQDLVKKLVAVDGGVMEIDNITLKFGPGCLADDTEITLIRDDRNLAFESLLKLGLVNAIPRVIECLPDGLKFLKPACLTVRFQETISHAELFLLHGSYSCNDQKIIWTREKYVEEKNLDGTVNVQINQFCLYTFFLTQCPTMITRCLSHLNQSFTCRAYSLYRRVASTDMIDISVVLISEFVDDNNEENIKQLKDHYDEGYTKGERGGFKLVNTDRCHEIFLDFPGVDATPISFKVYRPQLDSIGFVIDNFKRISVKHPANGRVKVYEVHHIENTLLWDLSVREAEQVIKRPPDQTVVHNTTTLTNREIGRMSIEVGVEWDSLAGLMNIPYSEREKIRMNHAKYPEFSSKAEQIFSLFNGRNDFSRSALKKYFEELDLHDVKNEMLHVQENEPSSSPPVFPKEDHTLKNTPLSPREMSRLSRKICASDSYNLGGIMGISKEERDDIRSNPIYDQRSRVEKILSIFNRKQDFSREVLGDYLREIQKLDLVEPISTGKWRAVSVRPDLVKKLITVDGGVMEIDGITLKFGPGCLANDIEITLAKADRNLAFSSLLKLGLVNAILQVIECGPDGLKSLKPACLTVRFKTTISDAELVLLHGSYSYNDQKIIWKLVPNDLEKESMEEAVNVEISEFGVYSFISAERGMIAHILSHLNQSFVCRAYSLYRRLGTTDMIDISVVLISEFVDDNNEENIKQLKDHYDEGYTKGRKGIKKRVETDRQIEMFVEFPEVESTPISFKVDQLQLDSVGFAIDDFKEIFVKYPANGSVKVHEVPRNENELLWDLSVCETETVNTCQQVQSVQSTKPEDQPEVVYRTTRLTNREISRISTLVGEDWDRVAGLMDIPYSEREEIKINHANDQDSLSKAEKIFSLFNDKEDFCRNALGKCFEELNLHDVKSEIRPVAKDEKLEEELPFISSVYPSEDDTPLSPREMSRLSRNFSVSDSNNLADIMGISNKERENIRSNPIYSDGCSCAEKFLSIFNHRENFSRKALGDCLREIQKLDLIAPVITGEWRSL